MSMDPVEFGEGEALEELKSSKNGREITEGQESKKRERPWWGALQRKRSKIDLASPEVDPTAGDKEAQQSQLDPYGRSWSSIGTWKGGGSSLERQVTKEVDIGSAVNHFADEVDVKKVRF